MTRLEIPRSDVARIAAFGVELRLVEERDLPLLCRWRNDPDIRPFMDDDRPVSPEIMAVWLHKVRGGNSALPYMGYAGGKPVAYAEIKSMDQKNSTCEGGMFLFGKDYIGTGLGYNIVLCREIVMARLGLKTLVSRIRSANVRSIRFCEKYGGEYVRTEGDFLVYSYEFSRRRERLRAIAAILGKGEEFFRHFGEGENA